MTRQPLTIQQLTPNLLARSLVDDVELVCPYGVKLDENRWESHPIMIVAL